MRILLVDDEPSVRESFAQSFELRGHTVVTGHNGSAGLSLFRHDERFDAIVTDYMMPMMDGVEMVRRIREISAIVPIVIVTASYGDPAFNRRMTCLEGKSVKVVQKPARMQDILEAISARDDDSVLCK